MTLDQPPHHVRFARRAECRAGLFGFLHSDEPVNNFATLDQERMHGLIDAIDLAAQIGERRSVGGAIVSLFCPGQRAD